MSQPLFLSTIITPVFASLRQPLSGAHRPLALLGSDVTAASTFFESLADADDAALKRPAIVCILHTFFVFPPCPPRKCPFSWKLSSNSPSYPRKHPFSWKLASFCCSYPQKRLILWTEVSFCSSCPSKRLFLWTECLSRVLFSMGCKCARQKRADFAASKLQARRILALK